MLKNSKKIIRVFIAIVISLALGVTSFADSTSSTPIQTVEEYQKVIQEVNEEYGSFFCVPEEKELAVLNKIKELNETPEDLRNNLIEAWKDHLAAERQGGTHSKAPLSKSDKIDIPSTEIPSRDAVTVIPYSFASDIRQEIPIEHTSSPAS